MIVDKSSSLMLTIKLYNTTAHNLDSTPVDPGEMAMWHSMRQTRAGKSVVNTRRHKHLKVRQTQHNLCLVVRGLLRYRSLI